jgi:3-keto-5-aminohexanoate cleavage enzyme
VRPIVITAAITGSISREHATANHPLTLESIAQEAYISWKAGAAMVHCHARMDDGTPTNDLQVYQKLLKRIRDLGCDAIINFSSGDNGGRSDHSQRILVAQSGAEVITLAGGSFNLGQRLYNNNPGFRLALAQSIQTQGALPEIEIFDLGQMDDVPKFYKAGYLGQHALITFVMGIPGAMPIDEQLLEFLVKRLQSFGMPHSWSVCCQTNDSIKANKVQELVIRLGGDLRTGMEDCAYLHPEIPVQSNAELVTYWYQKAKYHGCEVMSADWVREHLAIHSFFHH